MRKPSVCQHLYACTDRVAMPFRFQNLKGGDPMTADTMVLLLFFALLQGIFNMLSD